MELPNQPIAAPPAPIGPPDLSLAAPAIPVPSPDRPVVATVGADLISSLQSLMGTVVIAIFVITFIVLAAARLLLLRIDRRIG